MQKKSQKKFLEGGPLEAIEHTQTKCIDSIKCYTKQDLIVWAYGKVYRGTRNRTEVKVEVFFRVLEPSGKMGLIITLKVNMARLGQLFVGSIWRAGFSQKSVTMDTHNFDISMDSASSSTYEDAQIPENEWSFLANRGLFSKNVGELRLMSFPIGKGKTLLIPDIEFFARCYGASEEIRRIIPIYNWKEIRSRIRCDHHPDFPVDSWPVNIKSPMVKADSVLAAHMLYDNFTQQAVKNIYAQTESAFENSNQGIALQVQPWFSGNAEIKVSGLWLKEQTTFLCLKVCGLSSPQGADIQSHREQRSQPIGMSDEQESNLKPGEKPQPRLKNRTTPPPIVTVLDDEQPDRDARVAEILNPTFEILGEERTIYTAVTIKQGNSKKSKKYEITQEAGDKKGRVSSGEGHGSGKGIAKAKIYTPHILPSYGKVLDMWLAMKYLQEKNKEIITSLKFYSPTEGFIDNTEPSLVSLVPFNDEDAIVYGGEIKNWLYIDKDTEQVRGLLICKLVVSSISVYIIEIERRPRAPSDDGTSKEESFQGLVYSLNDEASSEEWINVIVSQIRISKGRFSALSKLFPLGTAHTFRHSSSVSDDIACESAVRLAISKITDEGPSKDKSKKKEEGKETPSEKG